MISQKKSEAVCQKKFSFDTSVEMQKPETGRKPDQETRNF